jgi:hypothetical protein
VGTGVKVVAKTITSGVKQGTQAAKDFIDTF